MARISLKINVARWLLRQSGWGFCKLAPSFEPAVWDSTKENPGYAAGRWVPGAWPTSFWREPVTGTVMLCPSVFRPDFSDDSDFTTDYVQLVEFRWATDGASVQRDYFEEFVNTDLAVQPRIITLKRPSGTMEGLEDDGPAGTIDQNLIDFDLDSRDMCWAMQTTFSLAENEGFSFVIRPFGVDTDSPGDWYTFAFGHVWILLLNQSGKAELYERVSQRSGSTAAVWVLREDFEFSPGDPQGGKPFRLTIIPWGIDGISICFSQVDTKKQRKSREGGDVAPGWLYRINAHRSGTAASPYTAPNAARTGYTKTKAAPLSIGMRQTDLAYSFSLVRVRYKGDTLTLTPEWMDAPRAYITTASYSIQFIGYTYGGSFPTVYMNERTNGSTVSWTPATDYQMVVRTAVTPGNVSGATGMYTPELWACEADIPASRILIESGYEYDISDKWSQLSWSWSTKMEPTTMTVKFDRSDDFRNLLKQDGSIELRIDDRSVWIGQITQRSPAIEGSIDRLADEEEGPGEDNLPRSTQVIQEEITAESDWARVNREASHNASSLRSKTVGDMFDKALNRAGVPDFEQILTAELYTIPIDDWANDYAHRTPGDLKIPSEDASWGDVCREIARTHSWQARDGLRLWPLGDTWLGYVAEEFDPDTYQPAIVFYWSQDSLPAEVQGLPDVDRWQGVDGIRFFKILDGDPTSIDLDIRRPEYNSLSVFGATSSGQPAERLAAFIAPDPEVLYNPEDVEFTGQVEHHNIGPQETGLCNSQNEVERFARHEYDRAQSEGVRDVTVEAEWQPVYDEVDNVLALIPDRLVWIVGKAPYAVPEMEIFAGENVSFGVWRVVALTVDTPHDHQTEDPPLMFEDEEDPPPVQYFDTSWRWEGNYSLQYVGMYRTTLYPAFTDRIPRLGRPSDWNENP